MLLRAVVIVMFLAIAGSAVFAQARGGMPPAHDPNAPGHWYPANCCSQRDCEPLPIDGVLENAEGIWEVKYTSPRFGKISEKIPRNTIRDSQDGRFHGCWRPRGHPGRGGEERDHQRTRTICFFVPLNS